MHTRRTPCEDEGRDCSDVSTIKECQRLLANHQKLGERPGTDSPSQPLEGTNPTDTLVLGFQLPEL